MFVDFETVKINYEFLRVENKGNKYLFLLHGFTGSLEDWHQFEKFFPKDINLIGIDIIGHGKSDSPEELRYYSIESIIRQIKKVKETVTGKKIFLLGYSMGGRAALNYAINFPYDLLGLILESATAGITNSTLRFERKRTDKQLADFIRFNDIENFVDDWMNKEVFHTQKKLSEKILQEVRERKLQCSKIGLANILIGFGTGNMQPVYEKLSELKCPVQLISGELDRKFVEINQLINKLIQNAQLKIIPDTGHNVHLEETKQYADIVYSFVSSF